MEMAETRLKTLGTEETRQFLRWVNAGSAAIPATHRHTSKASSLWAIKDEVRLRPSGYGATAFTRLAEPKPGEAERRLVAQIFTSWNPLMSWLEQANRFRLAA